VQKLPALRLETLHEMIIPDRTPNRKYSVTSNLFQQSPSAWTPAEQDELVAFLRQLAQDTRCKTLLTSRRDEQGWLGDLPARVGLPPMPMLERLELARAIAARQTGGTRLFLQVEDWRPLLEFTQGNPLTITILVGQALRDKLRTRAQIEAFVARLRAGEGV